MQFNPHVCAVKPADGSAIILQVDEFLTACIIFRSVEEKSGLVHSFIIYLYVNLDTGQYWVLDYRLIGADGERKTRFLYARESC